MTPPYDALTLMALIVIVCALPTAVWRVGGVLLGGRLADDSPVFRWVKLVATSLVAALVAQLMLFPAGSLAQTPMLLRAGAIAAGGVAYLLSRRTVSVGILAGEAVLVGGTYVFGFNGAI